MTDDHITTDTATMSLLLTVAHAANVHMIARNAWFTAPIGTDNDTLAFLGRMLEGASTALDTAIAIARAAGALPTPAEKHP